MPDEPVLTVQKVHDIYSRCLASLCTPCSRETDWIDIDGPVNRARFCESSVEYFKSDIRALLAELPDSFHQFGGRGHSFLHAFEDRHGRHWGEHRDMEMLFMLGMAAGLVDEMFPRAVWPALPGGMPYYVVKDNG